MSSGAAETEEKISWIRDGAGDRFDQIEIEIGAYFVGVGDGAADQLDAMAARFGVAPTSSPRIPTPSSGRSTQVCETAARTTERFGVSYITVAQRHLDEFAPVIAAMASTTCTLDSIESSAGSASSSTIVRQNSAAGTPSTTRWSHVRLRSSA